MTLISPPKEPTDPRLIEAANEIKKVLQRYDIMGVVTLASGNGHGEYVNWLSGPTWSAFRLETRPEDGARILRFKAQAKSAPAEQRLMERLKIRKTVNALVILDDVVMKQSVSLSQFRAEMAKHIEWDESEGVHTPSVAP